MLPLSFVSSNCSLRIKGVCFFFKQLFKTFSYLNLFTASVNLHYMW